MNEERERILRMMELGTISAAEANELLSALAESEPLLGQAAMSKRSSSRFERPWEIPFFGGIIVLTFGLLRLGKFTRSQNKRRFPNFGAWMTVMLGVGAILVGYWSRKALWLHFRVQERAGKTLNITLPLPLFFADWLIQLATTFMDEGANGHLQTLTTFVEALRRGEHVQPVSIELDEGDGDQVLIQIG